ncbi:MAG: hypothetical protein ACJAUG_002643 [Halioglobus sp.]|jgi:hypothetical protein
MRLAHGVFSALQAVQNQVPKKGETGFTQTILGELTLRVNQYQF